MLLENQQQKKSGQKLSIYLLSFPSLQKLHKILSFYNKNVSLNITNLVVI